MTESLEPDLRAVFGDAAFELRFSLDGRAAVRVLAPHGPVAARHAEPPDVAAPWSVAARCGEAAGWLLAPAPPAAGEERAREALERVLAWRAAAALQRLQGERAALAADLLESLTHRLRTDVSTLQAVAEGALLGVFDGEERAQIPAEVKDVGRAAQQRLSDAREVVAALRPDAARHPEPVIATLQAELDAAGAELIARGPEGELPMMVGAGPAWPAAARALAAALRSDPRLGGPEATLTIAPDPAGWAVTAGAALADGAPAPWTARSLGQLAHAGQLVAAAGGSARAWLDGDRLRARLTLPAAPSG
jgi:hypothetical protein